GVCVGSGVSDGGHPAGRFAPDGAFRVIGGCHHSNLAANWATRGLPVVWVMAPKLPLLMSPDGFAKCGVLVMLKNSKRNCSRAFRSVSTSLKSEKSKFAIPGPRTRFRPALPSACLLAPVNPAAENAPVSK